MTNRNNILIIATMILIVVGGVSAKTGNTIIGDSITNVLNISAERGDFNSLYELGERVITWINVSGQPKINQSITLIQGNNINLSQDTENKTITISSSDISFEIIGNNTDLCNFNHTSMLCDGIRQIDTVYWANESPIILNIFAHAQTSGQTAGVFIYRNGVLFAPQSGRPLAEPEQTWRDPGSVIIPKGWNYSVNISNYHHFEWREDQILSGRNGTISINQTIINQTITGNWVNKSGDNITGRICIRTDNNNCYNGIPFTDAVYMNSTFLNSTGITTQLKIDGISHAPSSYAYAMHIGTKVAPANMSFYPYAWGVGFYSAAQCDTTHGDFGNCASGFLASLTKVGSGNVTNAYGIYIQNQSIGNTTNYGVYSAGTNQNYFGGNVTINPLAGLGYRPLCASPTGGVVLCP